MGRRVPDCPLPTEPTVSAEVCENHLPRTHNVPRFFRIRSEASGEVGREDLRAAYDRVHEDYDAYWLSEAAAPIHDLIGRIQFGESRRIFEAGCGTGYATALLASGAPESAEILAADISPEMQTIARERVQSRAVQNVRFHVGDALEALEAGAPFDIVFSSWVLGYIPLKPFFAVASRALSAGGQLAFVVHKENSPAEPLEIFGELVAENPSVLQKQVAFDFPRGVDHIRDEMEEANLEVQDLWEGQIVFRYDGAEAVLDHLIKSGAGTAFYDALDPAQRPSLQQQFLGMLRERHAGARAYEVIHDYVACVARKS